MDSMVVTGGAGFIGANFVRLALAESDLNIIVVDKLTYAGSLENLSAVSDHPRFKFIRSDIASSAEIDELFREYRPRSLVNFAAETHVDRAIDNARPFIDTNIVGTFVLLEASRKHVARLPQGARAKFRFVHISTDEVYGTLGDTGFFSEATPYAPNSPYAASKASADHLVRAYYETYGLSTIITNCSNNYGPYQFPEKLIPVMVLNALEGKPLPIYGDGGNVRDWLYVEDHCSGIDLVLKHGRPGEKYNIGGQNERTNLQVVDTICAALEKILPASRNPALKAQGLARYSELKSFVTDRPGHDRRYAIDASKIRSEFDWAPRNGFDEGMAKTVQWYHDHREWCEKVVAGKYQRERLGLGRS